MTNSFLSYAETARKVFDELNYEHIAKVESLLTSTQERGKRIYIFGNGGSGANASHISGDFVKGASLNQKNKFRFICLNDNLSALSATANDISYDDVFKLQLDAFVEEEDLVIGLSGSGNSENVLRAIELANKKGAITIGFCGYTGGKLKELAKHHIHIPVNDMEITEDFHMIVFHMIKQSIVMNQSGSLEDMGDKYKSRLS